MVDGEDISHLDVQCRLSLGVEIIELVNVEVDFSVRH